MWPQNRIVLQSTVVAVLLLGLGTSGAWYVLQLQRQNSNILDVNVASIRAAEELEFLIRETRYDLRQFLILHDRSFLSLAMKKQADLQPWVEQALALSRSENEEALAREVRRGLDDFFSRLQLELDTAAESNTTATINQLIEDTLTTDVLINARKYLDLNEQQLEQSNLANKALAERLALALMLLGTCGAIAGIVAGYGVARGVSRSVLQLSVSIRDVAGKLDEIVGPIDVVGDPSFTDLETVLQAVSAKVGAVVDQLQARKREVIRADQLAALGQLAAGLAHELRNPLMCMKTLVQSTRRRGKPGNLDESDLRILDEEITRLDKLLQAFLDFARPANPEPQEVDLVQVVRQTVELVARRAELRNVTIDCRLPKEPVVVYADTAQLRQVFLNLLLNALDATDNRGSVWIDAIPDSDNISNSNVEGQQHSHICLRVADNGKGLPSDERNRIFEPFFSTKQTGLGLGLATSQRIVEAHGGKLVAFDREGGGAVFEVHLPADAYASKTIC